MDRKTSPATVQGRRSDRGRVTSSMTARRRPSRSSRRRSSRARSSPSTIAPARCWPWSAATASRAASSIARRRRTGSWARRSSRSSTPRRSIAADADVTSDRRAESFDAGAGQPPYTPGNYDGKFEGTGDAAPRARALAQHPGGEGDGNARAAAQVVAYAQRFGFSQTRRPYLSMALGAGE